jgi:caffeoyl-CoA O-methyltransferase
MDRKLLSGKECRASCHGNILNYDEDFEFMMHFLMGIFLLPFLAVPGPYINEPDPALFKDIDDHLTLPVLQTLCEKPGRWNVPPRDGRFLYDLVLEKGYRRGLEIGTSNGFSTLWLGLALRQTGGKIITIEVDRGKAIEARENFRSAQLESIIDSRLNDMHREMAKLQGTFDFVFLDAWINDHKKFLDLILPKLSVGGALIAHNVMAEGSLTGGFLGNIKNNKSLDTRIYQASQSGMSVSIKLKD